MTSTVKSGGRRRSRLSIVFLAIFALVVAGKLFMTTTINQNQTGAVFLFGNPVEDITEPGLYYMPFWYSVTKLEKRFLLYDSDPKEIITFDKKTLVTDDFALWRIESPTLFIQRVGSPASALKRVDDAVYSKLLAAFGASNYDDIVVNDRVAIIDTVTTSSAKALSQYGINVASVLINRVELPAENKQAAYTRMSAERKQKAQTYRSEGGEEALKITSLADRDARIILANANRDAAIMRGEADALAAQIYADAYSADPEFYALVRGLEAAEQAFGADSGTNMRIIMQGDETILKPLLK